MAIEIGQLSYVSSLNNEDFQAKSLQDIKLITTRLQLTGDTSGIEKYDAAFKAAAQAELQIQKELNAILTDAKVRTEELTQAVTKPANKTIFSDSAAEVRAYQEALVGLESGAAIVAGLNEQLDLLIIKQETLTEQFTAGAISEAEYNTAMIEIGANQITLVENIKRVNDAFSTNIIVQNENVASIEKTTVAVSQEIGVLNELKITLASLKKQQTSASASQLPIINKQIQETQANIAQFSNIGKVGFDQFGAKIEETAQKTGKFEAAVSRATNVSNIGARIVTQFTRQIVGLGVGFLSLEIGAKAIKSLIEYIQNLDVFTGRLDEATQRIAAFKEINADADKTAGNQIAPLKALYEATQNVALSMDKRIAAAEQLREQYPAEFENSTNLAIVNGKLKNSYDELSQSILDTARSQAAITKIGTLASENFDQQLIIDENNIKKATQIQKAFADYKAQLARQSPASAAATAAGQSTFKADNQSFLTPAALLRDELAQIASQANAKNLEPTQIITTNNKTMKYLTSFTSDVTTQAKKLADANKLLGDNLENFNSVLTNANNEVLLKELQSALQTKLNSLTPNDAQFATLKADLKRVDDLLKEYQVKATKTTSIDPAIALLASEKKILDDIAALNQKGITSQKTADEQAQDAVIASYIKMYQSIKAENVKYQEYIKTHSVAEATKKGLQFIDPAQINASEIAALQSLAGKQSVEATKNQVDQQKAIFKEYEDFKLKAGTEAADKLFGTELDGYKSYIEFLKSLQPSEADLTSADPFTKARATALNDYLKVVLPQAQIQEFDATQKHLQSLIIQYQDWQQKRLTLIQKANDEINILNKGGFTDQAKQLQSDLADQLTVLEVTGFESESQFKKLFTDITNLSTDSAKTLIKNAQDSADALFLSGEISVEAYNKITQAINRAQQAINDRSADKLLSVGNALGEIGKSFQSINSGVASYITGLASLATSLGNVQKQYDQFQADAGDTNKQIQDGIALVATGVSALVNLIGTVTSASAARKKAETDYYNSVIEFQNQYNIALDEQIRLQYKTNGNIFLSDFSKQLSDAAKSYNEATKQYQASLSALAAGQAKVGQKNTISGSAVLSGAENGAVAGAVVGSVVPVIGTAVGAVGGAIVGALTGLFGGKKKVDVFAPLLAQYPQLIDANGKFNEALAKTLIATNQVSDATKTLLQNTISYYDEQQASIDQINSALSTLSNNLGSNLEQALVTAFENGTDAAKAFGDSVSAVISNIIQQFLFEDIFGAQFQKLNDQLKSTVLGGGTSADITKDFVDFFKQAGPLVQQFQAGLQAAKDAGATQGLTLFPSSTTTSGQTSLAGGIQQSITEATATILEGTLNGIQLGVFNTNQNLSQLILIAQDSLNTALLIQVNTRRTADNSDSLPEMLNQLKKVSSNTEGSLSIQLRAIGA